MKENIYNKMDNNGEVKNYYFRWFLHNLIQFRIFIYFYFNNYNRLKLY